MNKIPVNKVPVHVDPTEPDRVARAPFSFVPFPNKVFLTEYAESFDRFVEGFYSGYVDLTVTCETPTYVRSGFVVDADPEADGLNMDFFNHGNPLEPVIPGSSVRGAIRALVEIMAFGKMRWVSDRKLVYREVAASDSLGHLYRRQFAETDSMGVFTYPSKNLKAGYLRSLPQGGYVIQPAVEHEGVSFVRVDYETVRDIAPPNEVRVKEVWVEPVPRKVHGGEDPGTGKKTRQVKMALATNVLETKPDSETKMKKGFLVVTTDLTRPGGRRNPTDKHMHCIIYEPDEEPAKTIPIPEDMWQCFEDDEAANKEGARRRRLDPGKPGGDPVFYLVDRDGRISFFGPTLLFRLPYPNSIGDYIPAHLKNEQGHDLAEAIFGTVDGDRIVRGRVLFGDLRWVDDGLNPYWGDGIDVSPKILSTPKPTAFQEYLTQRVPDDKKKLWHWGSDPDGTTLRGHKLYWHKPWDRERYWELEPVHDSQHTIIRPVKPRTKFRGRIRFDNLTSLELGALLSAINLPEHMRHKLGMGKPLGMGSVRLQGELHLVDREARYKVMFDTNGNLETGGLPPEKTEVVINTCVEEFRKTMVKHAASQEDCVDEAVNFWGLPRLKELGIMLSKEPLEGKSHDGYFDYPPLREGNLDGRYWKGRRVIPTPNGLVRFLTGGVRRSSATTARGKRQSSHTRRAGGTPSEYVRRQPGGTRVGKARVGEMLEATIDGRKTKSGKPLVRLAGGQMGFITNVEALPSDLVVGRKVKVKYKADGNPYAQVEYAG